MGLAISGLFDSINSLSVSLLQSAAPLLDGLAQGIPELYGYASMAEQAILPIGYTILSLFFLLELFQCSTKVESAGGGASMGVQMISGVMVKLVLCKLLMDNVNTVMIGIFDSATHVTGQVARVVPVSMDPALLQLDVSEALTLNVNFFTGLPHLFLSLIILILVCFVWLRTRLMIYLRFLEAYLYLIISPIPLATLPGGEWSQIGKNFLKSFAAVAIQGTLLYLTLSFYPAIVSSLSHQVTALDDSILSALLNEACYMLLLLFALAGTTRLADKICNAM